MHVACFPMKRFTFGNDPHLVIEGLPGTRNMQILLKAFNTLHIQVEKFGIIVAKFLFHIKNACQDISFKTKYITC